MIQLFNKKYLFINKIDRHQFFIKIAKNSYCQECEIKDEYQEKTFQDLIQKVKFYSKFVILEMDYSEFNNKKNDIININFILTLSDQEKQQSIKFNGIKFIVKNGLNEVLKKESYRLDNSASSLYTFFHKLNSYSTCSICGDNTGTCKHLTTFVDTPVIYSTSLTIEYLERLQRQLQRQIQIQENTFFNASFTFYPIDPTARIISNENSELYDLASIPPLPLPTHRDLHYNLTSS